MKMLTKPFDFGLNSDTENVLRLIEDNDDYSWVDFLRQHRELDEYQDYAFCIKNTRQLISDSLADDKLPASVKSKYEWLKHYFNEVVSEQDFNLSEYFDDISITE